MKFSYANNATPINQDETFNLIPSGIITQDDLNVFEQKNIKDAEDWLFRGKNKKLKISDDFIRKCLIKHGNGRVNTEPKT